MQLQISKTWNYVVYAVVLQLLWNFAEIWSYRLSGEGYSVSQILEVKSSAPKEFQGLRRCSWSILKNINFKQRSNNLQICMSRNCPFSSQTNPSCNYLVIVPSQCRAQSFQHSSRSGACLSVHRKTGGNIKPHAGG